MILRFTSASAHTREYTYFTVAMCIFGNRRSLIGNRQTTKKGGHHGIPSRQIVCSASRTSPGTPAAQTSGSAGLDLRAALGVQGNSEMCHDTICVPGERALIPTGLGIELPDGYEATVRPRGSLAYHHGVGVLNAPGTIDSDYRGEIQVILINLGTEIFMVNHGDRIAQLVISQMYRPEWQIHTGPILSTPRAALGDLDRQVVASCNRRAGSQRLRPDRKESNMSEKSMAREMCDKPFRMRYTQQADFLRKHESPFRTYLSFPMAVILDNDETILSIADKKRLFTLRMNSALMCRKTLKRKYNIVAMSGALDLWRVTIDLWTIFSRSLFRERMCCCGI